MMACHMTVRSEGTMDFFDTPLDHFHPTDTRTFPMGFEYSERWAPEGNVSFALVRLTSGQELADCLQEALLTRMAELVGAAVFCIQHRYYGTNIPEEGLRIDRMRWLNVEQAAGDMAQFVRHLRTDFQGGRYRSARVALMGCGEDGSVAVWARRAYPHLIAAAVADGAPLQAKEYFPEYLESVSEVLLAEGGIECVEAVRAATDGLASLMQTQAGAAAVASHFGLCSVPVPLGLDEETLLWRGVVHPLAEMVEGARPGTVQDACRFLTDATIADPVARLGAWVAQREGCLEATYLRFYLNVIDENPNGTFASIRSRLYQSCTQLGWLPTTSVRQRLIRADGLTGDYFRMLCYDFLDEHEIEEGRQLPASRLPESVTRVNLFVGGGSLPDHAVWAGGAADPWSSLGPRVQDSAPLTPVYLVPGVSSCRVIGAPLPGDSEDLERARNRTLVSTLSWLTEQPYQLEGFYDNGAGLDRACVALVLLATLLFILA